MSKFFHGNVAYRRRKRNCELQLGEKYKHTALHETPTLMTHKNINSTLDTI
jgi:hypothetical protein